MNTEFEDAEMDEMMEKLQPKISNNLS